MQIGMIGLGRMGANMAQRLMKGGHECVGFDLDPKNISALAAKGALASSSLQDFVAKLKAPRCVWMMVPAGEATEQTLAALTPLLQGGDIVIDGGNSHYKDDIRRAQGLQPQGIHYVDAGTSGGIWGAERGYCMMVGGPRQAFDLLEPIFKTLAPGAGKQERTPARSGELATAEQGYLYCGPSGSGHFVKMIHNGIEYGMMQAYAEGFEILRHAGDEVLPAAQRYQLNLPDIAEVWRRGSVVSSWLLDLAAMALVEDPNLAAFEGKVPDSGEGRWTVEAAMEASVPAEVLTTALYKRFRSRQSQSFADKLLSALRAKFGGHREKP